MLKWLLILRLIKSLWCVRDAQNAEQFLANLTKFAAETPFELTGLMEASKKLIAFKFDVQDIIPIMATVGDTA